MALTADAYARHLKALFPRGAAWNFDADSVLSQLLLGIGDEFARVDGRGDTLIDESDPRTTLELLDDWERVLALPDSCVTGTQSVAERRAAIVARLVATGGQSRAYYIAIAAALGFDITITEFRPFTPDSTTDDPCCDEAWAYAWQVDITLGAHGEFTADSADDEPLDWGMNSPLACVLNRLKPAHTTLLLVYH